MGYILLLFVLLLQAGGMLFIYRAQQCFVKYEMQKILNDSRTNFEKITLSLTDFKKCKINSEEISLNGKMYDIKSVSIVGDKAELLVVNDTWEEEIVVHINKFFNRNNQPNTSDSKKLQQLLTMKYLSPANENFFLVPVFSIVIFPSLDYHCRSACFDIPSPPPKLS